MPPALFRVVLDTNILVRAMINVHSASGFILMACERRDLIPLLSRQVLLEYHQTLNHSDLARRYPELTQEKIAIALERLAYIGDVVRNVRIRFEFRRDPRDAKFLELAIAGKAAALITHDPDLLQLRTGHDSDAKRLRRRLPDIEIMDASEFLDRYAPRLPPP